MTEMLELPDTIFEAAMIIILQQAIMNTLKWKKNGKPQQRNRRAKRKFTTEDFYSSTL